MDNVRRIESEITLTRQIINNLSDEEEDKKIKLEKKETQLIIERQKARTKASRIVKICYVS